MAITKTKRDITEKEWELYEWVDASSHDDPNNFIRGTKKGKPPNDGYKYVRVFSGDWVRAQTYSEKE